MSEAKILFSLKANVCFVKLIGELRHKLSPGFNFLVKREMQNPQTTHFVLDLKETEYLDSTNLGIMGMIAAGLQKKSPKKPVLLKPQVDILTILRSMGFDTLFEILGTLKTGELNYQNTSALEIKKQGPNELLLESHKTLAEINQYNKEKFAPVIEAILKRKK